MGWHDWKPVITGLEETARWITEMDWSIFDDGSYRLAKGRAKSGKPEHLIERAPARYRRKW